MTTDIKIYDSSNNVWENTQSSLTSGRAIAAIAAANDNAIIVIGWCTNGENVSNTKSTSLNPVELGKAELLPYKRALQKPFLVF